MMIDIQVETVSQKDGWLFNVVLTEKDSRTEHHVTMSQAEYNQIIKDKKCEPQDLIKKSFEFLLENESKESIMNQFGIMVIAQYFPNYIKEIYSRL